mmetsp:Transcript_91315/g.284564  ORF Transcript_91315/g.284564 Transcript_91315/m.284564 type:complete len:391 (-) Transcript_91315:276-1448(-)
MRRWGKRTLLGVGLEPVQRHGLRTLDGQPHQPGPDEVRDAADRAGDGEDDRVVVLLVEAVVLHACAGERVHVGPRVGDLPRRLQHRRDGLVADVGQLEERVVRHVLRGKLVLDRVARVGDPQRAMAEAGNHLARCEGVLGKLRDDVHRRLRLAQRLAGRLEPPQALLVRKAVQGPRQAVDARAEGEIGIAEGAADEVRGMGGHVAPLVVSVDHEVEARDLLERLGVGHAEHLRVVAGPVHGGVARDVLPGGVDVPENARGQGRHPRDEVEAVLQDVRPIVRLLQRARPVRAAEDARRLERQQTHRQLGHRVHVLGQPVDQLDHPVGQRRALVQLLLEGLHRLVRGDLVRQQEPEGRLGQADAAAAGFGQLLVALLQRAAAVPDPLHGVQV